VTTFLNLFVLALAKSTPLLLASFGGLLSELSGVINFAIEGMMLVGAFGAIWAAWATGSPWLGLLGGGFGGLVIGFLHAVVSLKLKANQIVSSIALNLLAAGITGTLLNQVFNVYGTSPAVPKLPGIGEAFSGVFGLPARPSSSVGEGLSILVPIALTACIVLWVLLHRSRYGLHLRACGENPGGAEAAGLAVWRVRLSALLAGGFLAGIGGAYLAIGELSQFVEQMTQGRGYLAVAAVILGRWRPAGVAAAALLFGFSEAFSEWLGIQWVEVPSQFFLALPYLLCLLVLLLGLGKRQQPSALGRL